MKLNSLKWQQLTPQLNLDGFEKQTITPMALQPKVQTALELFLSAKSGALLVLKASEQAEYAKMLEHYLVDRMPSELPLAGVDYQIEQANSCSFPQISVKPASANRSAFVAQSAVNCALSYDSIQLFGHVLQHPHSYHLKLIPGMVHQLYNGILILAIAPLLQQPIIWERLKQLLFSGYFEWQSPDPRKPLNCVVPGYRLPLKLILLGDRETLADFSLLAPNLYDFAQYAEIENYMLSNNAPLQQQWVNHLFYYLKLLDLPPLSDTGIAALFRYAVRESEDYFRLTVHPLQLKKWLTAIASISRDKGHIQLEAEDVEAYFLSLAYQQGSLQAFSYNEILRDQQYICTDGKAVGEINGLSVIEYAGTPVMYGEPSRITCTVQFGDGEITDIERKNELAGNIHAKGTMLAQYCLSHLLDLPAQLPFAASIAFEQSYDDIDGDSASLAQFCVLVSALANIEIDLGIAVTGAIDQGGLVHAVGGVNAKIEGFYAICEARGLTGKQGVIIPAVCVENLSLQPNVVNAVKNDQFHIWPVKHVEQALFILTGKQLLSEREQNSGLEFLADLIARRIENKVETVVTHPFSRLFDWLKAVKR